MRKSRGKVVLAVVIIITIFTVIFVLYQSRTRELWEEINLDTETISSASIVNGNNGKETVLTKSQIETLYKDLKHIKLKPIYPEDRTGWSYSIDFEANGKYHKVFIQSPSEFHINDRKYEVPEKDGNHIISELRKIKN